MDKFKITQNHYNKLVATICREIVLDNWTPDYVVGITRGGLLPAVMISHYFNVPCHTLKVSLRDDESDCESNCWMSEDAFGYPSELASPKKILIVDDINDTGNTLNWIMNDWQGSCVPDDHAWQTIWNNNVRFAVVINNLSSKCNVKMDYWGEEINKAENDVWVDFPYESWWK